MTDRTEDEDELRDFDPCAEVAANDANGCGQLQAPWRYSRFCQACLWDSKT